MELTHQLILLTGALFLLSVLASAISTRLGLPLLLVFLALGMLAGEDGPGGIHFDDVETTYLIGTVALSVILFNGGLCTDIGSFRVGLWPALWLATVGVVATGAVVGVERRRVVDSLRRRSGRRGHRGLWGSRRRARGAVVALAAAC